eukprot:TRINITY_DN3000_c0_g3_i2.p1 TRINITY_DN3000_c0_g3~~TRINITY_DN3000_c0_g3_i2.p1  ORF type:complete len:384 (-),score=54.31 TRINITY_DN3000_c0_g3_i2:73-1224(-)
MSKIAGIVAESSTVSEIAFQNNYKLWTQTIERSAQKHLEFWQQLAEDQPDLSKLLEDGNKISYYNGQIEEIWNRLIIMGMDLQRIQRFYSQYLLHIANDKDQAEKIMQRIRTQAFKKFQQEGTNQGENDANPVIYISIEDENLGFITNINLAAAVTFGYNKTELLNRKINVLMPNIIAKYHDQIMDNYLSILESKNVIGKQRLFPGKTKMNYIFPMTISIKHATSIVQGAQMMATFKTEKAFRNYAYALVNYDTKTVENISSSSINILGLNLKKLSRKQIYISDLIPDFHSEEESIYQKGGTIITVTGQSKTQDENRTEMEVSGWRFQPQKLPTIAAFLRFEPKASWDASQHLDETIRQSKKQQEVITAVSYTHLTLPTKRIV